MSYKENPKTKGSGIYCAIPHSTRCPVGCPDCFFQSGRSYLEPLEKNLPNMPPEDMLDDDNTVIRFNDGNDSNFDRVTVFKSAMRYPRKFFNTSFPIDLAGFPGPVVLTANPNRMTYTDFHKIEKPPPNLMFVRARTCTWNLPLVRDIVNWYTSRDVVVVLTFLAYFLEDVPDDHKKNYEARKRVLNEYSAITTEAWKNVMLAFFNNIRVYSCGKIEGVKDGTKCRWCGNCLREYHATTERMRRP